MPYSTNSGCHETVIIKRALAIKQNQAPVVATLLTGVSEGHFLNINREAERHNCDILSMSTVHSP